MVALITYVPSIPEVPGFDVSLLTTSISDTPRFLVHFLLEYHLQVRNDGLGSEAEG